jgi:hypothetical protein
MRRSGWRRRKRSRSSGLITDRKRKRSSGLITDMRWSRKRSSGLIRHIFSFLINESIV